MKPIKLLPLMMIFVASACQLDPSYTRYDDAVITIENRIVPENATVNVPLNIYASTSVYNTCWSNISFVFKEDSDFEYNLYAVADFESYGTCSELTTSADTVITMTPETTGDYVINVWTSGSTYERDTIKVEELIP